MLDAAGAALFLHGLQPETGSRSAAIRRSAVWMAAAGAALTVAQHVMGPARLAGSFGGIIDPSLQAFYLESDAGTAHGLRIVGMAVILLGVKLRSDWLALTGAVLTCLSFVAMGHTATHDPRWFLAALLTIHIVMLAFWFGSLRPMRRIASGADAAVADPLEDFSRIAVIAVPFVLVAGVVLAAMLLKSFSAIASPYGLMVIAKIAGFALLIVMASVNRWRLVPRIRFGDTSAARGFRNVAAAEWLVIAIVIVTTEVTTSLVSP